MAPRKKPNNTRKASSESYLPDDVLETILSRLPLKSILRFKSVSKTWNDLTHDPRFGRIHAQHNRNEIARLFLWFTHPSGAYRLARFDEDHRAGGGAELDLRFPHETFRPQCSVEASCDGFFLLSNAPDPTTLVLWNPITGSSTSFPSCPNGRWSAGPAFGICHDSSNDDYKVVYVSNEEWYAVYSCRGRSWTEGRESPRGMMRTPGVTVRGVAYWISVVPSVDEGTVTGPLSPNPRSCYEVKDDCTHEIVYFDGAEGSCGFKMLERPEEMGGGNGVIRLASLDWRLCLYRNSYDCRHLQIWLLKQDDDSACWVKLANVRNLPLGGDIAYVKPLYLVQDHSRIVLQFDSFYAMRNQSFIMYDIRNETSKRVWTGLDDERNKLQLRVYTGLGSLVLPA